MPAETSGTLNAKKRDPKWTVMVFMGADNFKGNEPLHKPSQDDLDEISSVGGGGTLEIFVEVHHVSKPTRWLHFGVDGKREEKEVPGSPGEPALIKFIDESITKSNPGEDDYSMLVLWGHAYDFAFGRARTRGGAVDSIDFIELSQMLQQLQDKIKQLMGSKERPTLDIVGFDVCDIATVEMACQLEPFAKYLLGSEIGDPMPGWPYDRILRRLHDPIERLMGPSELGSYVVRRFCESYTASVPVSLSFLDLRHATKLRKLAEILALTLSARIDHPAYRDQIIELFQRSQTCEGRPYVDVVDLCLNLRRECGDPYVVEAARMLGDFLLS